MNIFRLKNISVTTAIWLPLFEAFILFALGIVVVISWLLPAHRETAEARAMETTTEMIRAIVEPSILLGDEESTQDTIDRLSLQIKTIAEIQVVTERRSFSSQLKRDEILDSREVFIEHGGKGIEPTTRIRVSFNENIHDVLDASLESYIWAVLVIALSVASIRVFFNSRALAKRIRSLRTTVKRLHGDLHTPVKCDGFGEILEVETALEYLRTSLLIAQKRAEEAEASRKEIISAYNHDMKHPIQNVLMGIADVKREIHRDNELLAGAMEVWCQHLESAVAILNSRVEWVNSQDMETPFVAEEVNIGLAVSQIVRGFLPRAKRKNLSLITNLDPHLADGVLIKTDLNIISRIVSNLIENAVKYTKNGFVLVNMQLFNGTLTISVRDTGIGIPAEALEKIFEPHVRLKTGVPGTGLGLSTVKRLVTRLGGTISVKSAVREGSEFVFSLPVISTASSQLDDKIIVYEGEEEELIDGTFLVVEDMHETLMQITQSLSMRYKRVIGVPNGKQALTLLTTEKIDFALVDINLPDISGFDVLAQGKLLVQEMRKHTVFVAFPADNDISAKCMAAGFSGVIVKPCLDVIDILRTFEDIESRHLETV